MTPELRAAARRQAGCFSDGQARRCGIDDATRARYLLDGEWLALSPGVYVCAGTPFSEELRAWSAVLAVGQPVALTACSAGLVYGLERVSPPVEPQLVVPNSRDLRMLPGVDIRRIVDSQWKVVWRRGLPLVPPAAAIRDMAPWTSHGALRDITQHALRRRKVSFEALVATLGRGLNGSAALRKVLDEIGPGFQVKWERMLYRAVLARGVRLTPQTVVQAPDGRRAFIDLGDEQIKYGVEIDGFLNHMTRFAADRKRARMLAVELGWTIAPYAVEEIAADLAGVADEVVRDVRRLRREAA